MGRNQYRQLRRNENAKVFVAFFSAFAYHRLYKALSEEVINLNQDEPDYGSRGFKAPITTSLHPNLAAKKEMFNHDDVKFSTFK